MDAGDVIVRVHQKIHGAIFFGQYHDIGHLGALRKAGSMRRRDNIAFCMRRSASKGHLWKQCSAGLQIASFVEHSWRSACGRRFVCSVHWSLRS